MTSTAPALTREVFDDLLLAGDPKAALRAALADGSLDALCPRSGARWTSRSARTDHHLSVLEQADIASMAPDTAREKTAEAEAYHRLLAEGLH
ncbi:MAG: hypothetical protein ACRDFY_10045 [Candidatus Limnocylindria bacterium]